MKEIFGGTVTTVKINGKHLPSDEEMAGVCRLAAEFLRKEDHE